MKNAEQIRIEAAHNGHSHWLRWGPYLAERQWGTVREDYSENGDVWGYFTHDQSRSRTYRWGEDGIAGISDSKQRLCFALALWNGHDPILKERLFGLSGSEGNHGEDVKELYYYLDSTPTHSYMKHLYKYQHSAFPYAQLLEENNKRSRLEGEFELRDTWENKAYFDVFTEYAKAGAEDVLESSTDLFGGNSNWRGPVWMPMNFLLITALKTYCLYYGDSFTVEYPTGSGLKIPLDEVADRLSKCLISIFVAGKNGERPVHGNNPDYASDPNFQDILLFYEYFHGETGVGLGANHQTGWTGLVATLIESNAIGEG